MKKNLQTGISFFCISLGIAFFFQNCSPQNSVQSNAVRSDSSTTTLDRSIAGIDSIPIEQNTDAYADSFTGYDVIVVAGQSNAVGAGRSPVGEMWRDKYKEEAPELDARILQVNRYEPVLSLVEATDTLQHFGYKDSKNNIGFGMAFARRYAAGMNSNRKIILVPAARGGTSIGEWLGEEDVIDPVTGKKVDLLASLHERLIFALNQTKPNGQPLENKFVALLWQHGEADIRLTALKLKGMSASVYVDKVGKLFGQIKNTYPAHKFSILIGEPVPGWNTIPSGQTTISIERQKREFKSALLAFTDVAIKRAYVRSNSENPNFVKLTSNYESGSGDDDIHYDARSQIALAQLYYNVFLTTVAGQLNGLRITNTDKFNASANIVDYKARSESEVPTNTLNVGNPDLPVKLGLDSAGGGYVNNLELFNDGINRVAPWFGRGMQTAFRDGVHSGRYNPTQAGFMDDQGAKVTILESKNDQGQTFALRVPQFHVPLFNGDSHFDYIQDKNLPQPSAYEDVSDGDWDLLDEVGKTFNDEIRSEFDYAGEFARVTQDFGTPAFKHTFYYAYNRNPDAILQFINPLAKLADGDFILNTKRLIKDISPLLAGDQTPSVTDMSDLKFVTFSGRIKWDPELFSNFYYYYKSGDNWVGGRIPYDPVTGAHQEGLKMPPRMDMIDQASLYTMLESGTTWKPDKTSVKVSTSEHVLILSNVCRPDWMINEVCPSTKPKKSVSLAYYYPLNDRVNRYPIVVMNRSDMSVHREEDRIIQVGFGLAGRDLADLSFATPRVELKLAGILSPLRYQNDRLQNRFEAVRQKIYMLFAHTPEEIVQAVDRFKAQSPTQ